MTDICYNCFREKPNPGPCPYCGYDSASDAGKYPLALQPGSILNGKYIVGRVLGQGGFGVTYAAQDYRSKQLAAIKEYLPEALATRTGAAEVTAFSGQRTEDFNYGRDCFMSEAKTLAEFNGNPNIVRVYSYFEENGTAYFAMEFIKGQSLQKYMQERGKRLSTDEANRILLPVMRALEAVHAKGIVHRDIAPDNIIVTVDGPAKLIDFGAARYSMGEKSRSLDVILKHGFAPKEQYSRHGRQGAYTDVYGMAATYYYTITGRVPPDSIDRMDEDGLVLPSSLGIKMGDAAEDALVKGLAVQAADRYQSMEALAQGLMAVGKATDEPVRVSRSQEQPLLKRAFIFLEDQDWSKADSYLERVLDIDPESGEAYLGKLMAELGVSQRAALGDCTASFDSNKNFNKALRYGDIALRAELQGYKDKVDGRAKALRYADEQRRAQAAAERQRGADEKAEAKRLIKAQRIENRRKRDGWKIFGKRSNISDNAPAASKAEFNRLVIKRIAAVAAAIALFYVAENIYLWAVNSANRNNSSQITPAIAQTAVESPVSQTSQAEVINPVTLRFANVNAEDSSLEQGVLAFADRVKELSNSAMKIDYAAVSTGALEYDNLSAVQNGSLDICASSTSFTELVPEAAVFELPFIVSERSQMDALESAGALDPIYNSALDKGIVILYYGENGFRHITNNSRPINAPEDLSGLTIRTAMSALRPESFETFGAKPVAMAFSEVYSALQMGVVAGQESTLNSIISSQLYDCQKYLTITGHCYSVSYIGISKLVWDTLSEAQQQILIDAGKYAQNVNRETGTAIDEDMIQELSASGMEVNYADILAFRDAAIPIWDKYSASIGADLIKQIKDVLEY